MLEAVILLGVLEPHYVYILSDHRYRVIFNGVLNQASVPDASAFALSSGDTSENARSVVMYKTAIDLLFSSDPSENSMITYN